jgi:lipopolysaccharide/colanic/teichoic acid biosynthesis glycosyltransferase
MRKTSIDELPQLWNVMCGDLSLVGPRPFPHYHLEKFSPEFRTLRCSVMPGVTGLWQVSDRSEGDLSRQEQLDSYYIRNWSPWMDLQLLARTVWTLLFKRGGAC